MSAVVSSGPDWNEAVEAYIAAENAVYQRIDANGELPYEEVVRSSLAAAYPALTRQAVEAERERIVSEALRYVQGVNRPSRTAIVKWLRAARAEPGTDERPPHE